MGNTILIIDDSPEDRVLYKRLINTISSNSYVFEEAETGEEGISLALNRSYSCIFVDYNLPDITGLEFLKCLFPGKENTNIPVIMITGEGDEHIAVEAMKCNAQDYLIKGEITKEALSRAMRNAIEKCRLQQAVLDKHEELEDTIIELSRKNSDLSSFYHTVSHELKTPLTAAREFSLILSDELAGPVNEQQKEYLEIITESCDHMTVMINDLLDSSRIEHGKIGLHTAIESLNDIVRHSVGAFMPQARKKQIKLEYQCPDEDVRIEIDATRIRQLISNLTINALKFTPSGGRIQLIVEQPSSDGWVRVLVKDNGRGIEEEKWQMIFERFYQERESDADIKGGLGLGLSISKGLAELHGGTIDVESCLGKGSTFSFTLPLSQKLIH